MSRLYFIRHGQASFGEYNYDKLSDTGERQSQILARYLCNIGTAFDVVFTGTLQRQIETAERYLSCCEERGLPKPVVERVEALNEYDSQGVLTVLVPQLIKADDSHQEDIANFFSDKKAFQRVFEKVMVTWTSGNYDAPGLPRWDDFVSRVNEGITMIMKQHGRGKEVALFTSGGPISVAVQRALNLSDEDTMRIAWQIANSSVTRFKCTEERIMMSSFNELSHLELEGDEKLITYR